MYYLPCGADMCKACLEDQHVKTCKTCSPDEDDDSEEDDEDAEARWREHEADYNSEEEDDGSVCCGGKCFKCQCDKCGHCKDAETDGCHHEQFCRCNGDDVLEAWFKARGGTMPAGFLS